MLRKENSGKQDNRNETEYDKIKQQPTGNENNSNKQNITYRREKQKKKKQYLRRSEQKACRRGNTGRTTDSKQNHLKTTSTQEQQ